MAGVAKFKNNLEALRQAGELSQFIHPDYLWWKPEWDAIRDCMQGERAVKERGVEYLPGLDSDFGTSYETYKQRAVFVNMTARTVVGMVGTVFRRPIKVGKVKKEDLENVTLDGLDLNLYAKKLCFEVASVGRVGVLVDVPKGGGDRPYMTEYLAENILSWRSEVINGREVLTYVLLREIVDNSQLLNGDAFINLDTDYANASLRARYRVLLLNNGVYTQRVYDLGDTATNRNPTFTGQTYEEITPTRNGNTLDYIPMVIIGALSPTPNIQKPPMSDIVSLNLSHYRTSAQLEHGRYNTALPVYYVPVSQPGEQGDYIIGPSVVWEVGIESKPGILEYFGTGLKSLTDGLIEKEEHIAQLGGRIMGIRPQATAESDNIYAMKQANEMSVLMNITESMSSALTKALIWMLDWQRKPIKGVRVKLNQDFKQSSTAARELRAIAFLYQEGILPIKEVFQALQVAEFIDEDTTEEDFIQRLKDVAASFPHQAAVEAMEEGFEDAADRTKWRIAEREASLTEMQADADKQHEKLIMDRQNQQQRDAAEMMFNQGLKTTQFEAQEERKKQKEKADLDDRNAARAQKRTPKPAPGEAGKPVAGAKPKAKAPVKK